MDPRRFQRLEQLFHGARERGPGERTAFLARECAGDSELCEEVRALLAHETRTALPLEPAPTHAFGDLVGEKLGPFRILRCLGEGGMGAVFEAEEEHPPRRVALKVLRLTAPSESVKSRFQREIRLLASLQHPGIAQIYAAGVARRPGGEELPYFALELVPGLRLDEFVRVRRPGLRERLALLAEICDAVQHAHQRGVIHRDLKPGNILVVEDPERGRVHPKVLDFGIARATAEESETALSTRSGQLLGTLAYMSPEQVLGNPAEQDTRSDVYSLGVILYELVCERLPLELDTTPLPEAARRIRDEEPPRPASLVPRLEGDVETIVQKALEKDRARRYQSAAELAEDLRRHLLGEAIAARSHSALYVLRRTVRRHRTATGIALVLFVSVLSFAFYASRQARVKGALAEELSSTAASLEDELSRSRLERGYLSTQLGAMETAETQLWREFLSRPDSEETLWALRNLYQRFPCVRTARIAPVGKTGALAHPDGEQVVVATEAGRLLRLNVSDLEAVEIGSVRGEGWRVALSEENGLLGHLGYGELDLYDLESLRPLRTLEIERMGGGITFLPGGRTLLAGGTDGTLFEIAVPLLDVTQESALHTAQISTIACDAKTGRIAIGDADGKLLILDRDRALLLTIQAHRENLCAIAFSPDGSRIATGGWDKRVRCWDAETGASLATMNRSLGWAHTLEFVDDGEVVRASDWWSYEEWNVRTGTLRTLVPVGVDACLPVAGGRLLLTLTSGLLRLWRPAVLSEPESPVLLEGRSVGRFDLSGEQAIFGDSAGRLLIAGFEGGGKRALRLDENRVVAVGMDSAHGVLWVGRNNQERLPNPDSRAELGPAALNRAGFVSLLDLATGEVLATFADFMSISPRSLDLSPDGTLVAFPRWGRGVEIRDARTAELVRCIPALETEVVSVRFSPDQRRLAYVMRDESIRIVDLQDGSEKKYPGHLPWVVAFHPNGERLFYTSWARDVGILDIDSGTRLGALTGHSSAIWDLALRPGHPDHLATTSADGTVRLWQLSTGRLLLLLGEVAGWETMSADFSRDGRQLLITSADGRARCIDLRESFECVEGNLSYQLSVLGPGLGLDPAEAEPRLGALLERAAQSE